MKSCFGTIFPDLTQFHFGKELPGKVFHLRVSTLGPGHRDRNLEVAMKECEDCQQCEFFRSCYDFSSAKLAMQRVISTF